MNKLEYTTIENKKIIYTLKSLNVYYEIITEDIERGRLKHDMLEYCKNEWITVFNCMYSTIEDLGILPYVNSYDLTILRYTNERLKAFKQFIIDNNII